MLVLLSYIGYVLVAIVIVAVLLLVVFIAKYLFWFNFRKCKHCNSTMTYKDTREDDNNGHYLFHCEHCGSWEEVPREEFFHSCDIDCNPNTL